MIPRAFFGSAGRHRVPLGGVRLLLLALLALIVIACGKEAPPRAAKPGASPPTAALASGSDTPSIGPTAARAMPDPRAVGDPNAPIQVIEYGDYQ